MPRAGLDAATVTEAGAALADEIGLAGLSMGAVAERLGVKTPSLYKHVASLADLQHRIAVLATADSSGDVTLERIPYPAGTAASDVATSFQARPGRPAVASVAGTRGAWLLDTRARTWTLIETPEPLLRATAVGDSDDTVVAVDVSGRVVVLSPEGVLAQTEPLVAADLGHPARRCC